MLAIFWNSVKSHEIQHHFINHHKYHCLPDIAVPLQGFKFHVPVISHFS